jgi:hypothetical protein
LKLDICRKLPKTDARASAGQLLLQPQLGQAQCRQCLDIADGDETTDIVALEAARAMQLEAVGIESEAIPTRDFSEIGFQGRLELAIEDGAGPQPAGDIAEHLARVDETVLYAHAAKTITGSFRRSRG